MPYIGEIRMIAGTFEPAGWMFCDGRLLPIAQNDALFTAIGTTYGGDGETTFGIPDLRGRLPVHQGNGRVLGVGGGQEEVTLTVNQTPAHTHPLVASTAAGSVNSPSTTVRAASATIDLYRETSPGLPMAATAAGPAGGSQPHTNLQPYLCINFVISLYGEWPSQT